MDEDFKWPTYVEPSDKSEELDVNFADVEEDSYYSDAVEWAVEKDITSGTTETTFSPNDTCTRAQIVTFLYRAQ